MPDREVVMTKTGERSATAVAKRSRDEGENQVLELGKSLSPLNVECRVRRDWIESR